MKKIKKRKVKNIAIIITQLTGGGAERVASLLSVYFSNQGYNVVVITNAHTRPNARYIFKGKVINIHVVRIDTGKPIYDDVRFIVQKVHAIRKIKKAQKIDASISFIENCNLENVLSMCGDITFTRVCTVLSEREDLKGPFYYSWAVIHLMYKLANYVVVMSCDARMDLISNYAIPKKKIIQIPNPVQANNECQYEQNFQFGKYDYLVVARIHPVKQIQHIIRAFSIIAEENAECRLLILGDGDINYLRYLRELVSDYRLDNSILFLGRRKDVNQFYDNARALILASRVEGWPNCLIEGMHYGIPVVVADCKGGVADILQYDRNLIATDNPTLLKYGIVTPKLSGKKNTINDLFETSELVLAAAMNLLYDDNIYNRYHNILSKDESKFDLASIGHRWEQYF